MDDSASAAEKAPSISGPGLRTPAKSLFIGPFLTATALITLHSAAMLEQFGFHPAWLGSMVAGGAVQVFLAWAMTSGAARTSPDLPAVWGTAMAGAVLALVGQLYSPAPLAMVYALASASGTIIYVFWYSRFGRMENPILAVGNTLPRFVLEDIEGDAIASQSIITKPTIFLFFRGNWCPLCMAQVREVAESYREIDERGAQIALVSPQPHDNTAGLAERFDVSMRFFADPESKAARRLGITHIAGLPTGLQLFGYDSDTVLPTVVVVDEEGRILMADQTDNYRFRPEPKTFLAALDTLNNDAP